MGDLFGEAIGAGVAIYAIDKLTEKKNSRRPRRNAVRPKRKVVTATRKKKATTKKRK